MLNNVDAVRDAALEAVARKIGSDKQAHIAKALDINQGSLSRITSSPGMSLKNYLRFLDAIGFDLAKEIADPDIDSRPLPSPSIDMVGEVAAGTGIAHLSDYGTERFDGLDDYVASESPYWRMCHGEPSLLRIVGESMTPRYNDGSAVMIRRFSDTEALLARGKTPSVVRIKASDEYTVKDVQVILDSKGRPLRVIGAPVNPNFPLLIWMPSEVEITHLVVWPF